MECKDNKFKNTLMGFSYILYCTFIAIGGLGIIKEYTSFNSLFQLVKIYLWMYSDG